MAQGKIKKDYTEGFDTASLKGVRLGLLKTYVSRHPEVEKVARKVLDRLSAEGAILVDVELPERSSFGEAEREVLSFEFKADLNAYLAERGGPMKTLKDVIDFNEANRDTEMPFFGQEIFLTAQARGDLKDEAYLKALANCARGARQEGIDAYLEKYKVEALISPTSTPAWLTDHINVTGGGGFSCSSLPAVAGYPHLTIPMGAVYGLPIGMSLIGAAWSDHRILQLGYAFEKITRARFAPRFLPSAEVPN
jgi:amidase